MAWKPQISLEEFEDNYIMQSNIDREYYNRNRITLPCNCEEGGCKGWASISKDPDEVYTHCFFHYPSEIEYLKYSLRSKKWQTSTG